MILNMDMTKEWARLVTFVSDGLSDRPERTLVGTLRVDVRSNVARGTKAAKQALCLHLSSSKLLVNVAVPATQQNGV